MAIVGKKGVTYYLNGPNCTFQWNLTLYLYNIYEKVVSELSVHGLTSGSKPFLIILTLNGALNNLLLYPVDHKTNMNCIILYKYKINPKSYYLIEIASNQFA